MRIHLLILVILTAFSARIAFSGPREVNPDESVIIPLVGEINDVSANATIESLYHVAIKNKKSVWIHIDSPGGVVTSGNKIIAAMEFLKTNGVQVNCSVNVAASMALHILAHCDKRYAEANSHLLWHPISISWFGRITWDQIKELEKRMAELEVPLDNYLREALGMDVELFEKHRIAETWWAAADLFKAAPDFLTEATFGDNLRKHNVSSEETE